MADLKLVVEQPVGADADKTVNVQKGTPLLIKAFLGDDPVDVEWSRGETTLDPGPQIEIAEVSDEHTGTYKAKTDGGKITVKVVVVPDPPNGDDTANPSEVGAYAQFEPSQLQTIAQRLWKVPIVTAGVFGVALVVFGVVGPLRGEEPGGPSLEASERFSAAFSSTLFLAGVIVICIGAWLQAASLRVAKLRPKEGPEVQLFGGAAITSAISLAGVGDLIAKMADAVKSLKVPVAVILVGAAMVIMSAVTVINTGAEEPCFTISSGTGDPVEVRGTERPTETPAGVIYGDCD